jgi:hypothetical protein
MGMSYDDLLAKLLLLTPAQLKCSVVVELGNEKCCPAVDFKFASKEHSSLDETHPILFIPDGWEIIKQVK